MIRDQFIYLNRILYKFNFFFIKSLNLVYFLMWFDLIGWLEHFISCKSDL